MTAIKKKEIEPICEKCMILMEPVFTSLGEEKETYTYWQCSGCGEVKEHDNEDEDEVIQARDSNEPIVRSVFIAKLQNKYYILDKTNETTRMYNPVLWKLKVLTLKSGEQKITKVSKHIEHNGYVAIISQKQTSTKDRLETDD